MTSTSHIESPSRKLPPVLGRLLSGSFWLALKTPLQAVFALWTVPLVLRAVGEEGLGAYGFAWGFGFFQFLLEFGMSSSLQRQVAEAWTKGDRDGVDRIIACGMNFYALVAAAQAAALLLVAYAALPYTKFTSAGYSLIVKLLWLQAITSPCFGLSMVVSGVLQAARRYDFLPRLEMAVVLVRFFALWAGVNAGVDFFLIIVVQTAAQVGLTLAPGLWVMAHELGHTPHFRGARWEDYRALFHFSAYISVIQLSVVLADKIDTTILGFALSDPGPANAVYQVVSKPFLQIRGVSLVLVSLVVPAVASLAAAHDERGVERIKYDGMRLHVGLLLPVAILAWIYAGPFLSLWVGDKLGHDAALDAPLLRLFLVAAIPVLIAVPVHAAIGMNRLAVIALAALGGALVNLPLSYGLTLRLGVSGVIWGSVLTTLVSNLLIPGAYVYRLLDYRARPLLTRTVAAPLTGALALVAATWLFQLASPLQPDPRGGLTLNRLLPLLVHLSIGMGAYVAGYVLVPAGRGDFHQVAGRLLRRRS